MSKSYFIALFQSYINKLYNTNASNFLQINNIIVIIDFKFFLKNNSNILLLILKLNH